MALISTPLTKLDAINAMLGAVFESPVNTLDVAGIEDAAIAQRLLGAKIRDVLLKGLANNVERNVTLTPDSLSKQIPLPINTLFVDSEPQDGLDVVQRGRYLYDRENHTFLFTRPVVCKVVYLLEWDDLPEHIKSPVMILAARRFQKHVLGDASKGGYDAEDELEAKTLLGDNEDDAEDSNMLSDSWSVASILQR